MSDLGIYCRIKEIDHLPYSFAMKVWKRGKLWQSKGHCYLVKNTVSVVCMLAFLPLEDQRNHL